jgi:uncharacterized protein YkwD
MVRALLVVAVLAACGDDTSTDDTSTDDTSTDNGSDDDTDTPADDTADQDTTDEDTPDDDGPGDDALPAPDAAPDGTPIDAGLPDAAPGVGEPPELSGITLLHNQVRLAVDTPTPLPQLVWSDALAATAQAWANQCIDTAAPAGLIDHNPNRSQGHPYYVGENVYGTSGTANAMGAVSLWAGEKANYNYETNMCTGTCGHYTQIVWRASLELGCALSTCPDLTYRSSIVCNYGPGGNSGGRPY